MLTNGVIQQIDLQALLLEERHHLGEALEAGIGVRRRRGQVLEISVVAELRAESAAGPSPMLKLKSL